MSQSLEFRYTNLIAGLDHQRAGGDLTFEPLPNGTWIVKEWNIRMPIVEELRTGRRLGNQELVCERLRRRGGASWRATTNAGQVVMDNAAGGIRGILTDSIGDPMPGEPVRTGTSTETQTGVDGTFSFTGVGAGRWTVLAAPYAFTVAGVQPPGVEVDVASAGMTDVRLQMPTVSSASERLRRDALGTGEAVVAGRVLDRNGEMVPGAQVRLGWQNVIGVAGGFTAQEHLHHGPRGTRRLVRFCAIPADETVSGRASLDGRISEEAASSPGRPAWSRSLRTRASRWLGTPAAGGTGETGSLRFQVTDASTGEPVDGAMVGFPALNLFVLSDEAGNAVLPGIPPGNHEPR